MKKNLQRSKAKKEKIRESHIKKVSKVSTAEDLFLLTSNFKKEDNKKLHALLNKENSIKKKTEKDKEIVRILKKGKDPLIINESISSVLIEEIENRYSEIKEKGSEQRKKGKDTLIAELKLMSAQYKLKLFKATKDKKDYLKIKKNLEEAERDLT